MATLDNDDLTLLASAHESAASVLRSHITQATAPPTTAATPPPATTAPAPPPPSGTGTVPSGNPMTGLNLGDTNVWGAPMFQEDFPTLSSTGQFATIYKQWTVYPKGWPDTSKKGIYDPARITVVDTPDGRVLRQQVTVNADGTFGGCVLQPDFGASGVGYATTVRYSERVKLVQQDQGHHVLLGWPAVDSDWPTKSGEPDHYEYDTFNNPTINGWLHVIGATTGQDHQVQLSSDVKAYDAFHVVTVEQVAGKSYRRYIDGKLYNVVLSPGQTLTAADNAAPYHTVLPSGYSVPGADPLRICKQLESNGNKPTGSGVIVDTDWVVIQLPK